MTKLTFGFEIEGAFKHPLHKKVKGVWKSDSTVHVPKPDGYDVRDYVRHGGGACGGNDTPSTEFASEVYPSGEKMLEALARFDEEHYLHNETCGLHVHVGTEDRFSKDKLYTALSSWQTYKSIEDRVMGRACDCLKARLGDPKEKTKGNSEYAMFNQRRQHKLQVYGRDSKYRFMHFHHGHGTVEFRYLAPCEHKVENARLLLGIVEEIVAREATLFTVSHSLSSAAHENELPRVEHNVGGTPPGQMTDRQSAVGGETRLEVTVYPEKNRNLNFREKSGGYAEGYQYQKEIRDKYIDYAVMFVRDRDSLYFLNNGLIENIYVPAAWGSGRVAKYLVDSAGLNVSAVPSANEVASLLGLGHNFGTGIEEVRLMVPNPKYRNSRRGMFGRRKIFSRRLGEYGATLRRSVSDALRVEFTPNAIDEVHLRAAMEALGEAEGD